MSKIEMLILIIAMVAVTILIIYRVLAKSVVEAKSEGYEKGLCDGISQGEALARQKRDDFKLMMMGMAINTPVIMIPNEWSDPVVGFVKEIQFIGANDGCPVLCFQNYLSSEGVVEVYSGGVKLDFSEQKFRAIMSLNPFERWAVAAHNNVGFNEFEKRKINDSVLSEGEARELLVKNGFFERLEEFKATSPYYNRD